MSIIQGFNRAVGRWVLRPLCLLGIVVTLWDAGKRWRTLHGIVTTAVVQQQLGKEGSGSSGVATLLVRYTQPEHNQQFARVVTTRGTANQLAIGTPVQVGYHPSCPNVALLNTEWSYTPKHIGFTLVYLVTFFSLQTTRIRPS